MATKLEGSIIDLPDDYGHRAIEISNSARMQEFAGGAVHGVAGVKAAGGGKSLNAMHIMAVFVAIISKMGQDKWPHSDILAALDLVPEYLNIMISNAHVPQEAIVFFEGEMGDITKRS